VLHPTLQPSLDETITLEPDEVEDPLLWGTLLDVLQRLCRTLRNQRACAGVCLS
jgi:DNA polymerase-4